MNVKHYRAHSTVKDAALGIAEIVVSAYGPEPDEDGDIVVKGAVAKQIAGEYGPNPKGLIDHDWSMRSAVAKTLRMWEEDDGLHVQAQYNLAKQAGREAFDDLSFYGEDMEFSVGYETKATVAATPEERARGIAQYITEWQINEWSSVMLGANHATRLVSAKAGRVLSGANAGLLQSAIDALSAVMTASQPKDDEPDVDDAKTDPETDVDTSEDQLEGKAVDWSLRSRELDLLLVTTF